MWCGYGSDCHWTFYNNEPDLNKKDHFTGQHDKNVKQKNQNDHFKSEQQKHGKHHEENEGHGGRSRLSDDVIIGLAICATIAIIGIAAAFFMYLYKVRKSRSTPPVVGSASYSTGACAKENPYAIPEEHVKKQDSYENPTYSADFIPPEGMHGTYPTPDYGAASAPPPSYESAIMNQ